MDYRPLDITVISASVLENLLFFFKVKVYVVVSLINGKSIIEKKTHSSHGRNPKWNHRIKFSVQESAIQTSTLLFVLRQHRLFGDKEIGEVSIPVRELLETNSDSGTMEHVVDYQVQSIRGKSKGTFTFSHQFRERVPADQTVVTGSSHPPPVNQQGMMPAYPQSSYSATPGYYLATQYGGAWYQHTTTPYPTQQVGYNQQV
ncbi:protein SRC2-like [Cynara cardunculus var. scolymus]|uniref:protein SRC2-like n=1 Tax=Cynara cardunculus var. scolymus TaxID=59895 RepID=UPI000D62972C|nr:protein SRC2-like [Cynara cardunculus var. scolymus]